MMAFSQNYKQCCLLHQLKLLWLGKDNRKDARHDLHEVMILHCIAGSDEQDGQWQPVQRGRLP